MNYVEDIYIQIPILHRLYHHPFKFIRDILFNSEIKQSICSLFCLSCTGGPGVINVVDKGGQKCPVRAELFSNHNIARRSIVPWIRQ